jgi:hypothetical protein
MFTNITLNTDVLMRPERTREEIRRIAELGFTEAASAALMALQSTSTNDFLEKLLMEAIGAVHSPKKLGKDGQHELGGAEAKPTKNKAIGSSSAGTVNDDSPMKLLSDYTSCPIVVFGRSSPTCERVDWLCVAPYSNWTEKRLGKIVDRLGLDADEWEWPETEAEQLALLQRLQTQHKEGMYVRSNSLSLTLLKNANPADIIIWHHPDVSVSQLPKPMQDVLRKQTSPPLTPSSPPASQAQ